MEQSKAGCDDTRSFIARKQSELVYGNTLTSQLSAIALGLLFAAVLYQRTNRGALWLWLALLVLTACGRLVLLRAYRKRAPHEPDHTRWLRYHFLAALTSGVVWTCGTVAFFRQDDPVVGFFIAMVVAGLVSGALTVLVPHCPSFCAFTLPTLCCFALRAALAGRPEYYVLAALTVLFAGVLLTSACHFNRMLMDTLLLNRENESLVEHLKLERNAAEAADRAKGMFLANMSHEIRTPMNGIIGMTELCLATRLDGEQKQYLNSVKVSAEHLLTIINDILDFSRIEAGKLELSSAPFLLRAGLAQLLQTFALTGAEKGVEVRFSPAPEVPDALVGDLGRLRQILVNLVGNAVKFTPGGEVSVEVSLVEADGDGCLLSFTVRDNGIGIPAEKLELIFDPFEQGDLSTTKLFGGTGLGLAISRDLVESLGGSIAVESEPGQGSAFTFSARFAFQHPAQPVAGKPPSQWLSALADRQAPGGGRRLSILVAEDVAVNQLLIKSIVERHGHAVTLAGNGEEAVQAWQKEGGRYDLIFMDIQMPVMDGMQATGRIRELEAVQGGRVPIVAMTAYARREDRERCREAGMDDFISKPYKQGDILALLNRAAGSGGTEPAQGVSPEEAPRRRETFDRAGLLDRLGGQQEAVPQLLALFIESMERDLPLLEQAAASEDAEALAAKAHALKGMAGTIGADGMQAISRKLELLAKAGDLPGVRGAIGSLGAEFDLFKAEAACLVPAEGC